MIMFITSVMFSVTLSLKEIQQSEDFLIKPESKVASLDTSQWPLLLKVGHRPAGTTGPNMTRDVHFLSVKKTGR